MFVYPVLLVAAGLFYNLLYPQSAVQLLEISVGGLIANLIFLTIASLGEEIGWRGVALPSLQKKYSPLISSAILGLLWAAWHLPFWVSNRNAQPVWLGLFHYEFPIHCSNNILHHMGLQPNKGQSSSSSRFPLGF